MRRGLRPTSWTVSVEPGSSAAATRNGAAEEMSPGTSTSRRPQRRRPARRVTEPGRRATRAPAAASISSVWSRVGAGSTHRRRALPRRGRRAGSPTSPARSRPAACSRSRRARRPRSRSGRRPSVVSIDGAHPAERLGDAPHRAARERLVADELEACRPGRRGCPAMSRASVPALPQSIGAVGRAEPAQADAVDDERRRRPPRRPRRRARARRRASTRCRPSGPSCETCVSPSQTAPIRSARCEIDLSPGTREVPVEPGGGLDLHRSRPARRRRRSPGSRAGSAARRGLVLAGRRAA